MDRTPAGTVAVLLALRVVVAGEAAWDTQVREMGYLIMQLSAMNAINGLNLSRDQAVKLRLVVKQVEAAGARAPNAIGPFPSQLEGVRQTYYELRESLLKNQPISDDLDRRVATARMTEAEVLRESMATKPASSERSGACTSCHPKPRSGSKSTRTATRKKAADRRLHKIRHGDKKRIFVAHAEGLYSKGGLRTVVLSSFRIDAILTPAQKEIVQNFACCLLPPEGLNDPVRAGQAEVSEQAMKIIRAARDAEPQAWPYVNRVIVERMLKGQQAITLGLSERDKKRVKAHFESVLTKTRQMSDVEFEMEKKNLCQQLKWSEGDRASRAEHVRRFMAAYFLLVPGLDEMYTEVIRRHDDPSYHNQPYRVSQSRAWSRE